MNVKKASFAFDLAKCWLYLPERLPSRVFCGCVFSSWVSSLEWCSAGVLGSPRLWPPEPGWGPASPQPPRTSCRPRARDQGPGLAQQPGDRGRVCPQCHAQHWPNWPGGERTEAVITALSLELSAQSQLPLSAHLVASCSRQAGRPGRYLGLSPSRPVSQSLPVPGPVSLT